MSDEPELPLAEKVAGVEAWVEKRNQISDSTLAKLASQFKLTKAEVRVVIDRARLKLGANAERYVEAHMNSVDEALSLGKEGGRNAPAALAVAQKGAEWAIERISQGASRIVDQAKASAPTTPQIVIGIAVGGVQVKNTEEESEKPRVMITSGREQDAKPGEIIEENAELHDSLPPQGQLTLEPMTEPVRLAKATLTPLAQPVRGEEPEPHKKKSTAHREIEDKVQKILAAVTETNAQIMTRSIIDLGYEPKFAWELVKATLAMDAKL